MKKTISINISGINFHIDEDAFEKLNRYLQSIASHFRGIDEKDEVMGDIESRIAELLQSKLTGDKQVVTIGDVDEVIRTMGQPSDFAPEDEASQADPYVSYRKRLYRDPEKKMMGGVCSGIGAYFNLDPLWVRLIFILLVLAPGFGILLYIILWLVVPEARTAAERLEMRGQPVTVSTLERSFRQEMGDVKEKVSEMAGKAKETYHRRKAEFVSEDRSYVKDNIKSVGHFFLRVLGILSGIVIFLMAASLSILFLFILFRFPGLTISEHVEFGIFPFFPLLNMLFENDADLRTFGIGMIILVGIPLLLLMLAGIRLVFRMPSIRYVNGAAGWIWLLTFVITLIFGLKIASSFRSDGEFTREQVLSIPAGDTLDLRLKKNLPEDNSWNYQRSYVIHNWGFYLADHYDTLYGIPQLRISMSQDSSVHIQESFYSRGNSRMDATERAEALIYNWKLDSNRLIFPESYLIPPGQQWRRQEVIVDLRLPEGMIFRTDDRIGHITTRIKGYPRHKMDDSMLIMTEEGVHQYVP
jgi:phage shock protein PspC (stress-responsive transcriptional regulator)